MGCASSSDAHGNHKATSQQPYPRQQVQPQHQQVHQIPPKQQPPPPQQQHPQQQNQQNNAPPQTQPPPPPQQQQQEDPAIEDNEKTEINVKPIKIDRQVLDRYLVLEKEIHQYEGKNILHSYKMKQEQIDDLNQTLEQLNNHYQQCIQRTEKEKRDVDSMYSASVKSFFQDQATYDATVMKEKEEYLEALNKQEVARKDLDGVTRQRDLLVTEIRDMKGEADKLQILHNEQDELLASIFNGKYGSNLENQLELEMDSLMDYKQRVSVARTKWLNGRVLLVHACSQLSFATRRWVEMTRIPEHNVQVRYTFATETRNNLIAASQNITSAQRYLHTIKLPYCTAQEMQTLNSATNNIYADMQVSQRHAHALDCYNTTHQRAAALLQWFDYVVNDTIAKDLAKASDQLAVKEKALRAERYKLIRLKIEEDGGTVEDMQQVDDNYANEGEDDFQATEAAEADNVSNAGDAQLPQDDQETVEGEKAPEGPVPLSSSELAPAPATDDLFGDIADLKKQHEKELDEFEQAQEQNKARMDAGLQEKIRARRSHRQRITAQEKQEQQAAQPEPQIEEEEMLSLRNEMMLMRRQ